MEQQEQIKDAAILVWQHKNPILKWTILAMLLAAGLSLLLQNYYKASTTFYPASLDLSLPDKIFGNNQQEKEFFGTGADLDRLLTIGASNELKDKLISEFGLFEHYKIDSTKSLSKFKIRKKIGKLLQVNKTKYDAIELSIEDKDKTLATNMTNRAREIINASSHKLIANRMKEMGNIYQKSVDEKSAFVKIMSDSLGQLRKKFPIYNIEAQTENLGNLIVDLNNALIGEQARYESLLKTSNRKDTLGNTFARIQSIKKQLEALNGDLSSPYSLQSFNEGVSKIAGLETAIERTIGQINEDKIKLQNTLSTVALEGNAIITVNAAEIPDYKSRPKRSLLVLASGVLTAMAMAFYYLLKHYSSRN